MFQPLGNEQFLTLGNFNDSSDFCKPQLWLDTTLGYDCLSYYYIDSINLFESDIPIATFEFEMPNVLTPNNDGINDYINFSSLNGLDEFEFTLFNRWGNKVYENNNSSINFDGKDKHGNSLMDGVYFYVLFAKQNNKVVLEKKGHLLINH